MKAGSDPREHTEAFPEISPKSYPFLAAMLFQSEFSVESSFLILFRLGTLRIDAYDELQHCVNLTVQQVLADVTTSFQSDLIQALNNKYSKDNFWTFKISSVKEGTNAQQRY